MLARVVAIVLPVFVVIGVGYLFARIRGERVRAEMGALNGINLNVLSPLMCFTALAAKEFDLAAHVPLLYGSAIVIVVSGLLAWPVARIAGFDPRTFVPPMMFNNCGNMGLLLASLAFGQSTAAGLVFAVTRIHLPDWLFTPLKLLGDAGIAMILFSLGIRLVDVRLHGWPIWVTGAIVCPMVGIAGAYVADLLFGLEPTVRAQLLLFAALPPAVLNFVVAEVYQQEPEKVASIVMLGNVAAIVFVPVGLTLGLAG